MGSSCHCGDPQAAADSAGDRDWFYCYVFVGLCAATCTLGFTRAFSFFVFYSRAGSRLHERMLSGVLQATMAFFCANPSGRILNKFSSDQGQIDEMLPVMLFDFMQSASICIGAVILVVGAMPFMLVWLVPITWAFVAVRKRFLVTTRELKRLDAISKSPLFAEVLLHCVLQLDALPDDLCMCCHVVL